MNTSHLSEDALQQTILEPHRISDEQMNHLAGCEACRARQANYRTLFKSLEQLAAPLTDFDPAAVVMRQMARGRTRSGRQYIGVALVLGLSFGVIGLMILLNLQSLRLTLTELSVPALSLILSAIVPITVFSGLVVRNRYRRQMRMLG